MIIPRIKVKVVVRMEPILMTIRDDQTDAERAATELLLKRLVTDMHKMHARFDHVEAELASLTDKRVRVTKPAPPLVPPGPGEAAEGGESAHAATSSTAPQPAAVRKAASSKAFVGKVASERRAATAKAAVAPVQDLAATPGGGQLTARSVAGAAGAAGMGQNWALGSLAALADPSRTPLAPPNPAALFSQGNEAASNLMGGFMGGLTSLGDSVSKGVPAMPEGFRLPAIPEMPSMNLQMPAVPSFTSPAPESKAK